METTNTVVADAPRLFLTDYASYNNGSQFEFGHWVDLTDFADADAFQEYIQSHFEEADEKRPLGFGKREETMFTDFENFPKNLYSESMSSKEMEQLFEFINLDDDDKVKAAYLIEDGQTIEYALSNYEDIHMYENSDKMIWELFEMFYPDAEKSQQACPYLSIDYDQFVKENYNEFEYNGESYLVESY